MWLSRWRVLLSLVLVPFLAPAGATTAEACIPGNVNPQFQDFDEDGAYGLYARSDDNMVASVGPDGALEFRGGPSHCWLAGDPDDDGQDRATWVDRPEVPVTFPSQEACAPGKVNPQFRDEDADGEYALYARGGSPTVVAVESDGDVQQGTGPSQCWLAGDPDDDGGLHPSSPALPVPIPGQEACVPNGNPQMRDFDGDAIVAVYARGESTMVVVGPTGAPAVREGQAYCWLAGDPDDDGQVHADAPANPVPLPAGSGCAPGGSYVIERDFDGDRFTARYVRSAANLLVGLDADGSLKYGPGPFYCWVAGDLDDDGTRRAENGPVAMGDVVARACVPGVVNLVHRDYDDDGRRAVYSRGATNSWLLVHSDGKMSQAKGPADCWLAGDPDDDGATHVGPAASDPAIEAEVAPGTGACVPGESTIPITRDLDQDGQDAVYLRTGVTEVYFESDLGVMVDDGGFCWSAGDVDDNRPNRGHDIYAFGDSVTAALTQGLAPDGSDSFVFDLRDAAAPNATVAHAMDGSGRSSWWGTNNLARHLPTTGRNGLFIIEFGLNDRRAQSGNLSVERTLEHLADMYEAALPTADHVVVALPLLSDPSGGGWAIQPDEQRSWIDRIEEGLTAQGIPTYKMYDALDSVAGNGVPDDWDGTHYLDNVHPAPEGHRIIGNHLAAYIASQGWTTLGQAAIEREDPGMDDNIPTVGPDNGGEPGGAPDQPPGIGGTFP